MRPWPRRRESVAELAARFESDPNGHLSTDLKELAEAGFVAASAGLNPQTGKPVREVRYRLKDNYTRFYLKYVLPKRPAIEAGVFRYLSLERLPGWDTIMGLQFENLVLNNFTLLAREIGLVGKNVESAAPYFRRGGKTGPGVQIDLLVQLPRSAYVVEIKRKGEIGEEVEKDVAHKVARLSIPPDKSVRTALVYEGRLHPVVKANAYFDALVDVAALMGCESR